MWGASDIYKMLKVNPPLNPDLCTSIHMYNYVCPSPYLHEPKRKFPKEEKERLFERNAHTLERIFFPSKSEKKIMQMYSTHERNWVEALHCSSLIPFQNDDILISFSTTHSLQKKKKGIGKEKVCRFHKTRKDVRHGTSSEWVRRKKGEK